MPEKYDPLKSAELTTEQNYNMIDGILNNGRPRCSRRGKAAG